MTARRITAATRSAIGRLLGPAVLLLALFALAGLSPLAAQTFPPLTGRVVDAAGLLDAGTKASLEAKLAAHEQASSDQLVIATVPDLQGYEIEDYGYRLGRAWKIGREDEDNGAILLVSRDDRKVRIEVGYGLEGTLTDALSRVVIENDILPRFKAGDYPGGIVAGTDAILAVLSGDADEVTARAERNAGWQSPSARDWIDIGFVVILALTVVLPVAMALLASAFGRRLPDGRRRFLGMTFGGGRGRAGRPSGWIGGFGGGSSSGGWSGGSSGGGFSGGGGSFGGGGSSGSW